MTHFSPMTAIRAARRPAVISTFTPQGGAVVASPGAATVTPISTRRPDAPHGVGPCVGQEMPPQANLPRPAGATIATGYESARAVIALALIDRYGHDEARRLLLLADMEPLDAVAPMLANALQAAEDVLARVFPGGVA